MVFCELTETTEVESSIGGRFIRGVKYVSTLDSMNLWSVRATNIQQIFIVPNFCVPIGDQTDRNFTNFEASNLKISSMKFRIDYADIARKLEKEICEEHGKHPVVTQIIGGVSIKCCCPEFEKSMADKLSGLRMIQISDALEDVS